MPRASLCQVHDATRAGTEVAAPDRYKKIMVIPKNQSRSSPRFSTIRAVLAHDCPTPCMASAGAGNAAPARSGMTMPLCAIDDEEGERVDPALPAVIDAHVHLFPPGVFEAIWRWFDRYGWPIRYKLHAREVVRFLLSRGVERIVALHYAHKPGMARALNAFMAELVRDEPRVTGLATVFPGEDGAVDILRDAFAAGLAGVKLHCHVQAMAPDDPSLHDVYATCQAEGRVVVIHAGREPRSDALPRDPRDFCDAGRVDAVLRAFPRLRLCVPHLGADEFGAYAALLEKHDNLWLDTTMVLADYFAVPSPRFVLDVRPERILYGTDFPNLPYAWDRELRRVAGARLSDARLETLLSGAARALYGLQPPS